MYSKLLKPHKIAFGLMLVIILALPARVAQAQLALFKGREEEAVSVGAVRELARVHYLRARSFYRRGEYAQAKAELQEVLKLEPEHQGAKWYLQYVDKELAKPAASLPAYKSRSKLAKPSSTEGQLRAERKERARLEKEEAKLRKQLKKYQTAKANAQQSQKKTSRQLAQLQRDKRGLEAQVKKYQQAVEKQERQIKELKRQPKPAESSRFQETEVQAQKLASQLAQLRQEQDGLVQRKFEKYQQSLEKAVEKYESKVQQLDQTSRQLARVERQKDQLQAELSQLQREQEQLFTYQAREEEEQIVQAEDKLQQDLARVDQSENQLVGLQMQINAQLQAQLDALKKEKAQPLYEQGLNLFKQKKYAQAKESLERALAIYPDFKAAKDLFERIRTQETIDVLVDEGQHYYKEKDYLKAKTAFNKALSLDFQNQQARVNLHKAEKAIKEEQHAELLAQQREQERLEQEQARLVERQRQAEAKAMALAQKKLDLEQAQIRKEQERKAREEELARRKAEQEKQRLAKLKAKEKQRKIKEEQRLAQLKAKEEARKAREKELAKLKVEKERLRFAEEKAREKQRLAKLKAKEEVRKQQEKQRLAKLKAKEEVRKQQEKQRLVRLKAEEESRKQQEKQRLVRLKAEEESRKQERLNSYLEKVEREKQRLEEEKQRLAERQRQAETKAMAQAQKKLQKEQQHLAKLKAKEEARQQQEKEQLAREQELTRLKAEKEKARQEKMAAQAKEQAMTQARKKLKEQQARKDKAEKIARLKAERGKQKKQLQRKIDLHYSQGKKHFKNRNYIAARKEFKDILHLDPDNQYAVNALDKVEATVEKEEKDYQRHKEELEQTNKQREELERKEHQQIINQHFAQGKVHFYRDEQLKAINEFGKVLILDPDNTRAERFIQRCKKQMAKAKIRQQKRLAKEKEQKEKQERLAKLKAEQEQKLAQLKAEKEEKLRLKREAEQARREQVRLEKEQQAQRKEQQRLARLKAEEEARQAREQELARRKAEQEEQRLAKLKAEEEARQAREKRLAQLQLEKEKQRLAKLEAEQERLRLQRELEAARREQARLKREEEREHREEQRLAKLKAEEEARQAREERLARIEEEKEKVRQLKKEQARLKREQAEEVREKELARRNAIRLHLAQGKIYFLRDNYARAMEEFKQMLLLDPENAKAEQHIRKCQNQIQEQKERKVQAKEKEAVRLKQTVKVIKEEQEKEKVEKIKQLYRKGKTYFRRGLYSEAIACFKEVIELEGNPRIHYTPQAQELIGRAEDQMKEKQMRDAQEVAKEEIKRKKTQEQQKVKAEDRAEQEALRRKEESIREHYNLGKKYYSQGNYPMAIAEMNKIAEIDPQHAYVAYAEKYIAKSQQKIMRREEQELRSEMKQEFKVQKEEEEISSKSLYQQARWYYRKRDYERAIEICRAALELNPLDKKVRNLLYTAERKQAKTVDKYGRIEKATTERDMMAEVEQAQGVPILPEIDTILVPQKDFVPIVKIPPIREKLRSPITVDFRDVDLNFVLNFLSDSTGVNIIPASGVSLEGKKVTMKMKDIRAEKALKYILKNQGLNYRIEEDAVWVASPSEMDKEEVETRVYFLNRGSGMFTEFERAVGTGTGLGGAASISKITTLKDVLEEAVNWPKDSKLVLDERSGALIISNIPSNLQIIEDLLYNLDVTPTQVLIETRFVELQITDTEELGIEWATTATLGDKRRDANNVTQWESGAGWNFSPATNATDGLNLTYTGVLTYPQFQSTLHAFSQSVNAKMLSAPRVTTLNNQMASIKVVDEWIYPTRYEFQVVQSDVNGDGDFDDANETTYSNVPVDFITKDIGMLLHVTPNVGADEETITLALVPEVSEGQEGAFSYTGGVSLPQFSSRSLSTSVVIKNGETVVLGGLVKESTTKTTTKVPILGDIPLLGLLFRKESDSIIRKNLLIFVTATIVTSSGEKVAIVPQE